MKLLLLLSLIFNKSLDSTLHVLISGPTKIAHKDEVMTLQVQVTNLTTDRICISNRLKNPAFYPFPPEMLLKEQGPTVQAYFLIYNEEGEQEHFSSFPAPKQVRCSSMNLPHEVVDILPKKQMNIVSEICLKDYYLQKNKAYYLEVILVSQSLDKGQLLICKSNKIVFSSTSDSIKRSKRIFEKRRVLE